MQTSENESYFINCQAFNCVMGFSLVFTQWIMTVGNGPRTEVSCIDGG